MQTRPLGNTGLTVSEVGLGCNRLGEQRESDAHWDDLVARSIDLGVTVFDTAEAYGKGRSEEVLGRVIADRTDLVVASKYSPEKRSDTPDFSMKSVSEAVEESLTRLKRSRIDVYQIHSPKLEDLQNSDWFETFSTLKSQGKIGHVSVAVNAADEGCWLIDNDQAEVLQVTYNLIDRAVEDRLLTLAQEKGVGLLVRKPLSRGVLTGKFSPGKPVADHHRATHDKDLLPSRIEEAERFRPIGETYDGGLTRLAHHFSLSHPAASCIIPGARTRDQLEENVAASDGVGLTSQARKALASL